MSFLLDVILSNLYSTQDGFLELQSEQLLHHRSLSVANSSSSTVCLNIGRFSMSLGS